MRVGHQAAALNHRVAPSLKRRNLTGMASFRHESARVHLVDSSPSSRRHDSAQAFEEGAQQPRAGAGLCPDGRPLLRSLSRYRRLARTSCPKAAPDPLGLPRSFAESEFSFREYRSWARAEETREGGVPIPARALLIPYPNGDFEYDFTRVDLPSTGETVRRKGQLWDVTRVTQDEVVTVYVQPAADTGGGSKVGEAS